MHPALLTQLTDDRRHRLHAEATAHRLLLRRRLKRPAALPWQLRGPRRWQLRSPIVRRPPPAAHPAAAGPCG